ERRLRAVAHVVAARRVDEAGQQRRLGEGELGQGLAEELVGGGHHPVGACAEVDRVEVELEDPLLCVALLELPGEGGRGGSAGAPRAAGRSVEATCRASTRARRSRPRWCPSRSSSMATTASTRCAGMSPYAALLRFSSAWRVRIGVPSAARTTEDWATSGS